MNEIERLHTEYDRFVRTPWDRTLAGAQKVWFAIYDPAQERRLRLRIPDFEVATRNAGHGWALIDLTDSFAHWMAQHDYREAYFEEPELMVTALDEFAAAIADQVIAMLISDVVDEQTVVAVAGLATLFGVPMTTPPGLLVHSRPHAGLFSWPARGIELSITRRPRWLELSGCSYLCSMTKSKLGSCC